MFVVSHACYITPHATLLHFITIKMSGKKYKLWSSSSRNFLQPVLSPVVLSTFIRWTLKNVFNVQILCFLATELRFRNAGYLHSLRVTSRSISCRTSEFCPFVNVKLISALVTAHFRWSVIVDIPSADQYVTCWHRTRAFTAIFIEASHSTLLQTDNVNVKFTL